MQGFSSMFTRKECLNEYFMHWNSPSHDFCTPTCCQTFERKHNSSELCGRKSMYIKHVLCRKQTNTANTAATHQTPKHRPPPFVASLLEKRFVPSMKNIQQPGANSPTKKLNVWGIMGHGKNGIVTSSHTSICDWTALMNSDGLKF